MRGSRGSSSHPPACPTPSQGRVAALQSLSGTGSLRVGAGFIARFLKGKTVYISNPTWGNHRNIFGDEGVKWEYYRCERNVTKGGWQVRLNKGPLAITRSALNHTHIKAASSLYSSFYELHELYYTSAIPVRYYDADTVGLDFKGMMADITAAPDGSVILLHGEPRGGG